MKQLIILLFLIGCAVKPRTIPTRTIRHVKRSTRIRQCIKEFIIIDVKPTEASTMCLKVYKR